MNETTFENAKVGDRVWDYYYKCGKVRELKQDILIVDFKLPYGARIFSYLGHEQGYFKGVRTLFWDEIKFETPPRPKRKVKKKIEGWVHPSDLKLILNTTHTIAGDSYSFFVSHEYEVEE